MPDVTACEVPEAALLDDHRRKGAYTDCYVTSIAAPVSQARYVEVFYTTGLFRLERIILAALFMPSTDRQVRDLAAGRRDTFAAWRVESRTSDQLLLSAGRTRSWLMTVPASTAQGGITQLYFGSAVVPGKGNGTLGGMFGLLLGFHKIYSRALLRAAKMRLERTDFAPSSRSV